MDHTKALLRLLRNRGALAALPLAEKERLAAWLAGRQLYGSGAYVLHITGLRRCVREWAVCRDAQVGGGKGADRWCGGGCRAARSIPQLRLKWAG